MSDPVNRQEPAIAVPVMMHMRRGWPQPERSLDAAWTGKVNVAFYFALQIVKKSFILARWNEKISIFV